MIVFVTIMIIGFVVLLVSLLMGELGDHAGEVAHDIIVDHDIHFDHDGTVEHAQGGPSIFSMRFLSAFVTGFGGGGAIGRYYNLDYLLSSLIGIGLAFVVAGIVYLIVSFLYKHQSNSGFSGNYLVGRTAVVTIPIVNGGAGEVSLIAKGQTITQIARSKNGQDIPKGQPVTIKQVTGDCVIVD